jgi:hypothetical protein
MSSGVADDLNPCLEDLQVKFDQVELAVKTLKEGTGAVRSSISKTK